MKIVKREVSDLTPLEYKQCANLSFRKHGLLMSDLSYHRKSNTGVVYMIKDSDRLLSWALVTEVYHVETECEAKFYTRVTERRKGYGKALAKQVQKDYQKVSVHRSSRNKNFFDIVGL